jgi:hypothetical protein
MDITKRQLQKARALGYFWTQIIEFWLMRREFDLNKLKLDGLALQCALDAMSFGLEHLGELRRRLLDLGLSEEEIANPPFLTQPISHQLEEIRTVAELAGRLAAQPQ